MNPQIAQRLGINLDSFVSVGPYDNKTAPLYTKDGEIIRIFTTKFRPPLFQNGYVQGVRNSIEFQNSGNTDVLINGNWTIKPGGSKKFDSSNETDVNGDTFTVYFPTDPFNGLAGNRLEICEIILSDATLAFYRNKGIEYGQPGK